MPNMGDTRWNKDENYVESWNGDEWVFVGMMPFSPQTALESNLAQAQRSGNARKIKLAQNALNRFMGKKQK